MAKVKQLRQPQTGTLLIHVLPSTCLPEEAAVCLYPGVPVRIHNSNGGYLFTLEASANGDGLVRKFQDGAFRGRAKGERYFESVVAQDERDLSMLRSWMDIMRLRGVEAADYEMEANLGWRAPGAPEQKP